MLSAPIPSLQLNLRTFVREVPNFPKPGILFYDISPLLRDHFGEAIRQMAALFSDHEWDKIDCVAGIESRGFIMAAGLAAIKNKGMIKIRKSGKLPRPVESVNYHLEYGQDSLEMQPGKGRMIIVDDVLATGGTLRAAAELAEMTEHDVLGFATLIDIRTLNNFCWQEMPARSVIKYE